MEKSFYRALLLTLFIPYTVIISVIFFIISPLWVIGTVNTEYYFYGIVNYILLKPTEFIEKKAVL